MTAIIRQGFTVLLHNSSGCVVENVTLHSASFMAVTEFDGKGSNRYRGVRVVRRNVTAPGQLCATSRIGVRAAGGGAAGSRRRYKCHSRPALQLPFGAPHAVCRVA